MRVLGAVAHSIRLRYQFPGTLSESATVESRYDCFRFPYERLTKYELTDVTDAQQGMGLCRSACNDRRPHRGVGNVPPAYSRATAVTTACGLSTGENPAGTPAGHDQFDNGWPLWRVDQRGHLVRSHAIKRWYRPD